MVSVLAHYTWSLFTSSCLPWLLSCRAAVVAVALWALLWVVRGRGVVFSALTLGCLGVGCVVIRPSVLAGGGGGGGGGCY